RSQSARTETAYAAVLAAFRAELVMEGLDLDSADPRRCRADLALLGRHQRDERASVASTVGDTSLSAGAASGWVDGEVDPEGDAEVDPEVDRMEGVEDLEELAAARAAAIALVAQAFAARPAETRYGPRPVAPTTANLRLAVLSSFYAYAMRQDLLRGVNPITRVERRRV